MRRDNTDPKRSERDREREFRQRCFLHGFSLTLPYSLLLPLLPDCYCCVSQCLSRSQSVGHCCHAVAPVRLSASCLSLPSPLCFCFLLFSFPFFFSWPSPVSAYTAHTRRESCRWLRNLSRVCCLVTVNELTMWRIRNAHVAPSSLPRFAALGGIQMPDRQE